MMYDLKLWIWYFFVFQDPRLASELENRGTGPLGDRTVTVCSSLDLVNITQNNFVAQDEKTAKVRTIAPSQSLFRDPYEIFDVLF